jgi:hypothetical protein
MSRADSTGDAIQADYHRAQAVKERHEKELMAKANVIGVGIGLQQQAGKTTVGMSLVVMVTHKVPREQLAPEDIIPSEIDGVAVDIQEVGELQVHD